MAILDSLNVLDFVKFVKKHRCSILGCNNTLIDPDHLKAIGMGRNRKNPNLIEHFTCVPLCRIHHTERHSKGTKDFELKYGVNLWQENHRLLIMWLSEN